MVPADPFTHGLMPETSPTQVPRLARFSDLLQAWEVEAAAAHQAYSTGIARGPVTKLPKLDKELGGVLEPGIHVLHAEAGAGKTALALQISTECGFPALFITTEMAPLELLRRHTARVTGVFLGRLKSGELPPTESVVLARRAAAAAPHLAIADATQGAWASVEWVQKAALAVRGEAEHLLIVVDSVHSWTETAPVVSQEYDALNAGLSALRALAQTLVCPILCVAERNRTSMRSGGLSASAGSRKFEYTGTSVWDLTVSEKASASAVETLITLTICKNRNGRAGVQLPLRFHGALQRFEEGSK